MAAMFRSLKTLILGFVSLGLSACASTLPPTDTIFNASMPQSLLVATGRFYQVRQMYSAYWFRPVDLANGQFSGPPIAVVFGNEKSNQGDELRQIGRTRDMHRTYFAVKPMPPGDYALIGQIDENTGTGPYHAIVSICYGYHAPVFRLRAGEISIVDAYRGQPTLPTNVLPGQLSSDAVLADFARLRASYPNIQGNPDTLSPPVAIIQWSIDSPNFFDYLGHDLLASCARPTSFSVVSN